MEQHNHHPKQYVSQFKDDYTPEEVARFTREFQEKDAFLKANAKELSAEDFVRFIFPDGFEEENDESGVRKPNLLLSYIRDDQSSGRSFGRIVFNDLKQIKEAQGHNFVVMSPIAHSGRKRTAKNAYEIRGFAIDLDSVRLQNMKNLIYQMQKWILPPCTLLVNSGTGVHLYYIFDKPVPALRQYEKGLSRLKYAISDMVWNKYTSYDTEKQTQGLFQGYRLPGTQVKFSSDLFVTAYEIGSKVSLKGLDAFVKEHNRKYKPIDIDDPEQHLSLDQHRMLHPEWYQRRIVEKKAVGEYELSEREKVRRRKWYDAWIRRLREGARDGNRYHCVCVMFVFAMKAEIDKNEVMDDAMGLIDFFNSLEYKTGNEFTVEDVSAAAKYYDRKYITMSFNEIRRKTGIEIEKTERYKDKDGRPIKRSRSECLAEAREKQEKKMKKTGVDWREGNGRPDKRAEVYKYLMEKGDIRNISKTARELGMSRPTVMKYVNEVKELTRGSMRKRYVPGHGDVWMADYGEIQAEITEVIEKRLELDEKKRQKILDALGVSPEKETEKESAENRPMLAALKIELPDYELAEVSDTTTAMQKYNIGGLLKDCLKRELAGEDVSEIKKLLEKEDMLDLYEKVELPLSYLVKEMTEKGMRADIRRLERLRENAEREIVPLETFLKEKVGTDFNPNSTNQVSLYVYGRESKETNEEALRLAVKRKPELEEFVNALLSYRSKRTRLNEINAILENADENGYVHPIIDQMGTETGRMSMSKPNLQGLSKEGGLRACILPEDGYKFLSADYSQLEVRVLANLSEDPVLIGEIATGDVHTATAKSLFGDKITPGQRAVAKAINFGIMYGETGYGLAKKPELGLSVDEAKEYIDRWNKKHKKAYQYLERLKKEARKEGVSRTKYGRARKIEGLRDSNFKIRTEAERKAKNSPIQGTAADIAKIAMLDLDDRIKRLDLDAGIVLQIHDEIVVECRPEDMAAMAALMRECMTDSFDFPVPLEVDIAGGDSLALKNG